MRIHTRSGRGLAIVASVAAFTIGISGGPASAALVTAKYKSNVANADSHSITVWDEDCNNRGVYVDYTLTNGVAGAVSDPDGCRKNPGYKAFGYNEVIDFFRICEHGSGCSQHKYVR